MNKLAKWTVLNLTILMTVFTIGLGCGSGGISGLIIDPAGPNVVKKGETLQFSVDPDVPVTWSVEGGDDNGTIDSNGLYTPPPRLPINPRITVKAEDAEGQMATVEVDLRTADTIAFDAAEQVNDAPIISVALLAEVLGIGVSDRISVNLGSIHVDSVWTDVTGGGNGIAMFDQNVDFLGFGTDLDLFADPGNSYFPGSITTNGDLNPGIVVIENTSGAPRLSYLASNDQGASFGTPVDVDTSDAGDSQMQPNAKLDGQDTIHLAYNHESIALGTGTKIRYVLSSDDGANWSTAKQVSTEASAQTLPNLAVNDDGQQIFICYTDDKGSGGATRDIMLVMSNDGGNTLTAPVDITTSGTASLCRVALGSEGQVYVTYQDSEDVWFTKSVNGGVNFSLAIKVNSIPTNTTSPLPMLAVDSLGRIDVIWSADGNNDGPIESLMYARSTDGGTTFSANTAIDGGAGETIVFPFGLTHDLSGRTHVQFASNVVNPASGTYDVYYVMGE